MPLTEEQIKQLLQMVAASQPDGLDCDGCYGQLAEFAESQLLDKNIPAALRTVETHLTHCACCQDEFNALLEGLRAIEGGEV